MIGSEVSKCQGDHQNNNKIIAKWIGSSIPYKISSTENLVVWTNGNKAQYIVRKCSAQLHHNDCNDINTSLQ